MHLVVVGLSHKTALVEQREKAVLSEPSVRTMLAQLRREGGFAEAVALSTCNRTELYLVGHVAGVAELAARDAIVAHTRISAGELDCARYSHREARAASHLFRVSSSLDSMVVGESEIQGQVRAAWDVATEEGACGPVLGQLFRHAIEVGKRVRNDTEIGRGATSVASVAVDLACDVFDDLPNRRVLVIGAGQVAEATTRALVDHGLGEVTVANRTASTARGLAARFGGRGVGFDTLTAELASADIVISSTDAPHLLLGVPDVAAALSRRPERPMVLIDIAVPRDLDPAIASLPGAVLHNIDDLERVVEANLNGRRAEADIAERIVAEETERFAAWRNGLAVVPTLRSLRDRAEEIRSAELAKIARQWESLSDADRARLEQVTQAIVNKLLHEPTVRARAAAANGEGLRHVESLRHLFGPPAAESGTTSSTS